MAATARAETAPSFNLQPVTSPRLHQGTPERTCTPQGKIVQSVATPQRTGESPLAPKDLNSPGAGLLLIDVEPSQSRECTPKGLLQPRTPSAFARSLLDRTPGMFKAQLGTPLIPLGTPVTTRKKPQRTPDSTPAAAKENGTPAAVRRSARLASPCPPPQSPRAPPTGPTTSSASPSLGGVRFSTTPRKGRGTPRKSATPAKPTEATAVSFTLNGTATDVSPAQPASATSKVPAETPSRGSLAATSLLHSPFPAFSPSTPLIRTHDSYSDTELTDCDADGSIWEDDFEDPSFSYLSGTNETPVADAFARLRVNDVPEASALCSQAPPTVAHEDSVQLTATEVESASGSEAEADDDSLELGTIAEEDDQVASDDSSSTSTSDVACDQSPPEPAPVETSAEETQSVEVAMAPSNELAAAAFEGGGIDGEDAAAIIEERVLSLDESVADITEARLTSESPDAESTLATPDSTETAEQPIVANEAEPAPPQETTPTSPLAPSPSPPSPTQEAGESDAEAALAGLVAENEDDHHDEMPVPADNADELVPSLTAVEASISTSEIAETAAEAHDGRSASPSAGQDDEPACPSSPDRSEPSTPPIEQTTPLRVSNVPHTTTPAATPPRRPLTATVPTAQQPLGKAAPTARRQLTKLTSVAAQRPSASAKAGLTTLVPASSAAPRRLPVTSRLAVPKRIETSVPETSQSSTAAATTATASLPARAGLQPSHRVPASIGVSDGTRPPTGVRRTANLSASTSSNSSVEQTRPVRNLGDLAAPARAPSTAGKSAERRREVPVSSRLDRSGATTRAPLASSSTAVRPAAMPRRAFGGGPVAPQPTTTFTASRPRVAVLRPTASGASAKPSLSKTASLAAAPAVESLTGRAPRAALAVRQTASAPSLAASTSTGPSPVKPRRVTTASAAAAVSETPAPALLSGRARSPAMAGTAVALTSSTTVSIDAPPPTPSVLPVVPPPVSRSPLRASHLASPPRFTSAQTQASPLRSPRRVPVSQQMQPGIVAPSTNASILVAPAQTVAAAGPAVFGSSTRSAVPPRMIRTTRRTAQPDASAPARVAAVASAVGRPVRAAAMNSTYSGTAAPGPPPGGRMARKITRRQPPTDAEETASAESTSVTAMRPESAASSETTEEAETGVTAPARALPIFRPAPVLTQDELNRLTQRNTKKNQQTFNQLKLETVFLDYDRPPSPTSKIRKSSSLANAASKEGREARAAKRRNALRASVDGSELEALSLELFAEDIDTTPKEHYRAPGDEEPYSTPSRTTAVVKGAKGGSRAAGSKKRTSTEAALDSDDGGKAARRVRWDRSLVYEGPREGYAKPPDASIIVIKSTEIDAWGNPTAPPRDLGKAVPVTIRMRVFKNDEK